MSNWNYADVWETVASAVPEATALVHGSTRRTWYEFDRRASSLAAWLSASGANKGETVAQYLYSCPEYLESVYACFKLGVPPVNTNYRYGPEELSYLWDNADATTVVFHGTFSDKIEAIHLRLPAIRRWLWVDDRTGPKPSWATSYDDVVLADTDGIDRVSERSGDDLILIYTGGTTGLPKGVMWRHDDLFALLNSTAPVRYPEHGTVNDISRTLTSPGPPLVAAAPLMHGTGLLSVLGVLSSGGCAITLAQRTFSAELLLDTIARERAKGMVIVGDAFARPILAALDANPDRWDISCLRMILSSGVMWSSQVKEGLLAHVPRAVLVDFLGSSEALGAAASVVNQSDLTNSLPSTSHFTAGVNTKVLADDGSEVEPGSGKIGMLAVRGRQPIGYYKDAQKTRLTFRWIEGERWSVPGDFATVAPDGSLCLLGRGSTCINSGGEKIFPEEVEETLKTHAAVFDAVCVGVPNPQFGEAVTAIVELEGDITSSEDELISYVKARIAGYKAPRHILIVPTIGRAPNGKADYNSIRNRMIDLFGDVHS